MASTLQEALIHCIGGENAAINTLVIENRLHELDKDLDRLLTMDGSEIVDLRIKQISDDMLQLRQMKKRAELDAPQDMGRESKAKEIIALISAEDLDLTEYSDTLVYRVIERVTVLSKEETASASLVGLNSRSPFTKKQAQRDTDSLDAAGVSLCLLFSLRNGSIGDIIPTI